MFKKSKSLTDFNKLILKGCIQKKKHYFKKLNSFSDFNKLIFKGDQKFLSYGEYLTKNKVTTRKKRRLMIKYHYSNF